MPADLIPLEEARRRRNDGGQPPEDPAEECPIKPLGHADGKYYFGDVSGQIRCLPARSLAVRAEISSLFGGNLSWLEARFPKLVLEAKLAGKTSTQMIKNGLALSLASDYLIRIATAAGLYDDRSHRQLGIWADSRGQPVAHCGDGVLIGGAWQPAGQRIDDIFWVSGPRQPRPAQPADRSVADFIQRDIARLWRFRHDGGVVVLLGLVATAMLGAAARWRPNGFLTGGTGSGKSYLINTLRALCPMHFYTNDASAAGVLGAVNGRAMPVFIDEAADRQEHAGGARKLMDMVLSAAGGDGVAGTRGMVDGRTRSFAMAGSFLYASIAPPELAPQHLGRITIIELLQPEGGTDKKAAMDALIERCRIAGPALWGRMLARFDPWRDAVVVYRQALAEAGCAPREQDQAAAILAGYWCLVEDVLPTPSQAGALVAKVRPFVRTAADVAEDDGPRRAMQHLLGYRMQYDGSTPQENCGEWISRAFALPKSGKNGRNAHATLARHGMRVIPAKRDTDPPCPVRLDDGEGIWILPQTARGIFDGTPWQGDRWRAELVRLPGARGPSKHAVKIGGVVGKPLWVNRAALGIDDEPIAFAELAERLDMEPAELLELIDTHRPQFPIVQDSANLEREGLFNEAAVRRFLKNQET